MARKRITDVTASSVAAGKAFVATAGTALAAAAVAASVILSPVPAASARMDGVHQDLLRAVQLNQITLDQAASFEAKIASRIQSEA
ncbi:hypothetical protein ACQR35_01700 [Pseudarthrobacter sp. J1738]|uniref:hypothetical protein n=1 Tax=unclassified Pseudarthrobacter TaxID=2647000 RepID=UPI003D2B3633